MIAYARSTIRAWTAIGRHRGSIWSPGDIEPTNRAADRTLRVSEVWRGSNWSLGQVARLMLSSLAFPLVGEPMRLTRYRSVIRDFPKAGEHVLYCTLTDQYVGLDDSALRWMESLDDVDSSQPTPLDVAEIDWLREEGFLVEDTADDDRRLRDHLELVGACDGTLLLNMVVTERCNLACPYCFEGAGPRGATMDELVEEQVHAWVRGYMARHRLSSLDVQYFGGEPLLRKDLLLRSAERFAREAALDGASFTCRIVTNGVLLDRPFVEAMAPLGLEIIKVTLDGEEETHDLLRPRRDGGGTWRTIVDNLLAIAGVVPLRVGSNVPSGKEHEFLSLIDRLRDEGLGEAIAELGFKPVLDAGRGYSCGKTFSAADPNGLVRLRLRAHEAGLASEPQLALGPCGLHMRHYLVVDPVGRLFKCEMTLSDSAMSVGRVGDARVPLELGPLASLDAAGECGDCAYLPVCAGGCRAVTWAHEGNLGANCERAYFETVGREFIKRRYLVEHYGGSMPRQSAA